MTPEGRRNDGTNNCGISQNVSQYIQMFDRTDGIRFSHSPSGGGPPSATETAWDWQFIIPDHEVAQEYGYRARVVYRERCSRDEVIEEFKNWRATLRKLWRGGGKAVDRK